MGYFGVGSPEYPLVVLYALGWCIAPAQHVLYGTELLGLPGSSPFFRFSESSAVCWFMVGMLRCIISPFAFPIGGALVRVGLIFPFLDNLL